MSKENKLVVRRFWEEGVNKADEAVLREVLDPEYHLHDPDAKEAGILYGPDEVIDFVQKFRSRYQDLHATVDWQLMAEGDQVMTHYTLGGTVLGTGNRIAVEGLTVSSVSGGKITESWASWDAEGLILQDPGPNADLEWEGPAPSLASEPEQGEEEPGEDRNTKALVRRFWQEIFNEQNDPVANVIFTTDYRLYGPAARGVDEVKGPAGVVGLLKKHRDKHPKGMRSRVVEQQTVETDRLLTRYELYIPNKDRHVTGMSVSRIVQVQVGGTSRGMIKESWVNWDALALRIAHGHHDWHWRPWWW